MISACLQSVFIPLNSLQKVKHNAFLIDRAKTSNKEVLSSISTINEAMSKKLAGREPREEEKRFKEIDLKTYMQRVFFMFGCGVFISAINVP